MTVIGGVECSAPSGGSRNARGLRRVVLRVWGCTPEDVRRAESLALKSPRARCWQITEVVRSSGAPCPIPLRDCLALDQAAEYDQAWAAYPVSGLTL
jgi:hypothetical protein